MSEIFDVKSTKGKFFFTVLFVVIVVGIFIAAYIVPQRNAVKKLEQDLKSVEDELRTASQKVKELEILKKQWPIVKEERKALASLIPDTHKETDLVEFFHYLSSLYAIDIEQIDINEPAALPLVTVSDDKKTEQEKSLDNKLVRSIKRLDTNIRVGGEFNDILAFLDGIKTSNRYFEIKKVGLSDDSTAREVPGSMPMVIEGNFYFYSSEISDPKGKKGAFEQMIESEGLEDEYLEQDSAGKTSQSAVSTTPKEKTTPEEDIDQWVESSSNGDDKNVESNSADKDSEDNSSDGLDSEANAGAINDSDDGTKTARLEGTAVGCTVQRLMVNGSFVDRLSWRAIYRITLGVNA